MSDIPVGWQVTDPDGNIVDSGPGIELELATEMNGDQEGADDGSD